MRENFHSAQSIVQRDWTGAETRLKWIVFMDYIVAKFSCWILKEHYHNRSTKLGSVSKQQLNWTCWPSSQNPVNPQYNFLRNLSSAGWWSYSTTPVLYCTVQSSVGVDQLWQLNSINVWYDFAPYNHTTVQVLYCTVISRRNQDFACHRS